MFGVVLTSSLRTWVPAKKMVCARGCFRLAVFSEGHSASVKLLLRVHATARVALATRPRSSVGKWAARAAMMLPVDVIRAVGSHLGALEVVSRQDHCHRHVALGDDLRCALGSVDQGGQLLA